MLIVAILAAVVTIVLSAVAHNAFIRLLADRADARVKRVTEAETKADSAVGKALEVEKKIREVEKLLAAQASRALRR